MVELGGAGYASSGRNLPVCLGTGREKRSGRPARVMSDFASQLIAARDRMPVQCSRRRADGDAAAIAYDRTARFDERRLPTGYRLSLSV